MALLQVGPMQLVPTTQVVGDPVSIAKLKFFTGVPRPSSMAEESWLFVVVVVLYEKQLRRK